MYVHPQHRLVDGEALFALMADNALGTWVCLGQAGLVANHIPFVVDRSRGPNGTLRGHVSRANPVWRELGPATPSVVTFQGPQAYITPGWYPGKAAHGKVVPTWNYVVAHAHGVARVVDDREALLDMLNVLTDFHEAGQACPWRVGDAPASFIDGCMRAIVGIEIPIDRLEGKLKASQDEDLADRRGTAHGLRQQACEQARSMARLVMQAIEDETGGRP